MCEKSKRLIWLKLERYKILLINIFYYCLDDARRADVSQSFPMDSEFSAENADDDNDDQDFMLLRHWKKNTRTANI